MTAAAWHFKNLMNRVSTRAARLYRRGAARFQSQAQEPAAPKPSDDSRFRIPADLTRNELQPKKALIIGSCLVHTWPHIVGMKYPDIELEYITFNNASALPPMDAETARPIGFQLLQVPLRSVVYEVDYFQLRHSDSAGYERFFQLACSRLEMNLSAILDYNKQFGLLSFVLNFPLPQQNPMGRMLDRYSLSNFVFFVEELNRYLNKLVQGYTNVHIIDFDQIISGFGKKYFQDDSISLINHSSVLCDIRTPKDKLRLEPVGDVDALYGPDTDKVVVATFDEAIACYRSLIHHDSVKLVIFDLDDTLWRGVLAESDEIDVAESVEGWPISIVEALTYLWRRGILLAIASKNDEKTAETIWNQLYGTRFSLENFVVRKINWNPKAENIRDIIAAVNLQAENVLFVDDNPVERASVKAAIPGIRVLDTPAATWRRILLWSPELQPPVVTDESTARTDMVKLQMQRDADMARLDREAFLATLDLRVQLFEIRNAANGKFARSHELLNKTNQFNTTGVRWTQAELEDLFARGGYLLAADVADKYTTYGIVAVMLVGGNRIEQFVMSCRVFGLGVEARCMDFTKFAIARAGHTEISGKIVKTAKNILALDLFEKSGFTQSENGVWSMAAPAVAGAAPPAQTGEANEMPVPSARSDSSPVEMVHYRPEQFLGEPVNAESGVIRLQRDFTGKGYAVYGPYVPVPAGSYEATFLLKGTNQSGRSVPLNLDINREGFGLARSVSRTIRNRGEAEDITCRFDLKQDAAQLEFRICAADFTGCAFEFGGVKLKKIASGRHT